LASNPFAGEMEDSVFIPIGSFGAIWPLKHGTLGVGVFGMQGNKADFRAPRTPLAFLGNGDRRSEYQVARMPISYGYQFDNGWAFGGSLVPVFTRFRTDSITLQLTEAEGNHDWDKAFGLGFEVAFYKRWEQWSIGATYFSRGWVEDYELYDDDLITWNLDLPQKVQAGIAYRPIPAVELVLDYKWIEWTGTKVFGRKTINGGLAWQDQHIVKAGINWDINEQFSVRAGVAYGEAAVQPEAAYANALTPALSEFHLAGGFSWRINPRHEFHAAFTHVMAEEVTENGEGDIFSVLGRGTEIGYREDDLTLQYTYRF